MTAAYVKLGRLDEARATVARILESDRTVTVAQIGESFTFRDEATQERFLDAVLKAGLPEGPSHASSTMKTRDSAPEVSYGAG